MKPRQMLDRDVHLWQIDLADTCWDKFSDVLSFGERERASQFRSLKLQQRYRRCRSALRILLGRYSGQRAADIQFYYTAFGKPEMVDQKWHFNVSHSQNLALVAISLHPVGVDLELMNPLRIDVSLADVLCHPVEKTLFERLPLDERSAFFYQLLTKKEAYLKALGVGLQRPLSTLRFEPVSASTISQVRDQYSDNAPLFYVYYISSLIEYAVSVCLPRSEARISLFKVELNKFVHGAATLCEGTSQLGLVDRL